jgi:hypothetical protein
MQYCSAEERHFGQKDFRTICEEEYEYVVVLTNQSRMDKPVSGDCLGMTIGPEPPIF